MTRAEYTAPGPFRTFILKVANRCNIDCDYCYVFNSMDQAWRRLPARMSLDVARAAARRIGEHVTLHDLRIVHVVLHGGEPLLAGPRHLTDLLSIIREGIPAQAAVRFELQTNGTLLTETWLDLFEQYEVAVGVSLDGPPAANDRHRLTHSSRSSAVSAIRGIELLRSRPHLFAGLLAVVDLANHPVEVHDYLASFDPPAIDFNLPHGTHDQPPHRNDPNLPEYGLWMSRVYDAWLARPEHRHSLRMLEDIVALSSGVRGSVETLGLAPPTSVVVESDGTIEAVDTLRSVEEGASWLGLDVFDQTFDEALHHSKLLHRRYGVAALAKQCQSCPVVDVCGGGYLPHRFSSARGYRNPSVYCADLEYLIRHVQGSLRRHGWNPCMTSGSIPVAVPLRRDHAFNRASVEGWETPMGVTIRLADKRDVLAVADLIEEIERFYGATDIQPVEERQSQVEEALFGSPPLASAFLVEDETGAIVGLAAYSFLWPAAGSTHSLFLKELYVRDTLRRQGIGSQLMNELKALAAARPGCSRIEWMTDQDNPGARAFYQSLGFTEFDGKIVYRINTGAV